MCMTVCFHARQRNRTKRNRKKRKCTTNDRLCTTSQAVAPCHPAHNLQHACRLACELLLLLLLLLPRCTMQLLA